MVTQDMAATVLQAKLNLIGPGFVATARMCGGHFPFFALGFDDTVRRTRHAAKCDDTDCSDCIDEVVSVAQEIRAAPTLPANMVY